LSLGSNTRFIDLFRGLLHDEKEVSAYPAHKQTHAPFVEADWDLETMEPRSGIYPGQKKPGRP
jgi:hypothetical protein